jgi:hypothetical protein
MYHVFLYDTFTCFAPQELRDKGGAPWFFLNMCKWRI